MKEMGLGISVRCLDLVQCCGQDGYQAQVLQHPKETCKFMQHS